MKDAMRRRGRGDGVKDAMRRRGRGEGVKDTMRRRGRGDGVKDAMRRRGRGEGVKDTMRRRGKGEVSGEKVLYDVEEITIDRPRGIVPVLVGCQSLSWLSPPAELERRDELAPAVSEDDQTLQLTNA